MSAECWFSCLFHNKVCFFVVNLHWFFKASEGWGCEWGLGLCHMFAILLFTLVDGQGGGGVGVTILVIFCERHKCISYTVCDPLVSLCVFINVKLSKAGHFIRWISHNVRIFTYSKFYRCYCRLLSLSFKSLFKLAEPTYVSGSQIIIKMIWWTSLIQGYCS